MGILPSAQLSGLCRDALSTWNMMRRANSQVIILVLCMRFSGSSLASPSWLALRLTVPEEFFPGTRLPCSSHDGLFLVLVLAYALAFSLCVSPVWLILLYLPSLLSSP